jgi:hypothetical protein
VQNLENFIVPDRTLGGMYLLNAILMQWCNFVILLESLNCVEGVFIEGYIRTSELHDPMISSTLERGVCDGYSIPTIPQEGEWGYSWRQVRQWAVKAYFPRALGLIWGNGGGSRGVHVLWTEAIWACCVADWVEWIGPFIWYTPL